MKKKTFSLLIVFLSCGLEIVGGETFAKKNITLSGEDSESNLEFSFLAGGEVKLVPNSYFFNERVEPKNLIKEQVVQVSPFWCLTTEVTQELWGFVFGYSFKDYMNAMSLEISQQSVGPNYPVFNVSYFDACVFCQMLDEYMIGRKLIPKDQMVRLPTEAEWEFFCRAGSPENYHFGKDFDSKYSNMGDPREGRLQTVKKYGPNRFGLYDCHGNVGEWVLDVFTPQKTKVLDPLELGIDDARLPLHLVKGGGYLSFPEEGRCSHRTRLPPYAKSPRLGFRFVIGKRLLKKIDIVSRQTIWNPKY